MIALGQVCNDVIGLLLMREEAKGEVTSFLAADIL